MSPDTNIIGRGPIPRKPYTIKDEYNRLVRNGRNLLRHADSENINERLQELNDRAGWLSDLIANGHGDERYFDYRIVTVYPEKDITQNKNV